MIALLEPNYKIRNYVYSLVKQRTNKYKRINVGYLPNDIPFFSINRKINKIITIKI